VNKKKSNSVLVTGSAGFLGSRIVRVLINNGYKVRAFVRKTSRTAKLKDMGADLCVGDMADFASLNRAFDGIDYVVHAAADTSGDVIDGEISTIKGTKNVLKLCKKCMIKRLVYISSCNVYDIVNCKMQDVITEASPLETAPKARGPYTYAKFQAEQAVRQAITEDAFPVVCLRPGTIYGPGGEIYSPMMGFSLGKKIFLTIGDGKLTLPLVYVDNVADAIRVALEKMESKDKIYNVIDPYQLTKKDFIEKLMKTVYPRSKFIYFPFSILYAVVYLQEMLFKCIRLKPILTRYRLESSQKKIVYDGNKICRELNWKPPVSMDEALHNIINYEIQ
jgi:nucleoside-diphosphate-sugar epimerase